MNYEKIYKSIIENALNRELPNCYCEKHHILPKSMGGSNKKSNIAVLTAREHFLAHWLLYKIHKNKQMTYAFFSMTRKVGNGKERYTSRSFQYAREAMSMFLSINRSGKNHPLYGVRGEDNPNYGSKRSKETKYKLSEKAKGRESVMKKTIYCTETGEFFKSIKDAKKANKKGNISYALRFGGTAGGMHYQYVDEMGNPVEADKKLKGYAVGERSAKSVKVANKTTGEEFNSMSEAGESLGVTSSAISWSVRTGKPCRGNNFVKI